MPMNSVVFHRCKGTNFLANHNGNTIFTGQGAVVNAGAKVLFF
jgi:hypothetical protein